MSTAQLLVELHRHGVRLEVHGDRLSYSPKSAVTPDLARRMRSVKQELLAAVTARVDGPEIDLADPTAIWHKAIDQLEHNSVFPPEIIEGLRAAKVCFATADACSRGPESPQNVVEHQP